MSDLKRSLTDEEIAEFTTNGGFTKGECAYYVSLCLAASSQNWDSGSCSYIYKQCGVPTGGGGGTCGTCTCR